MGKKTVLVGVSGGIAAYKSCELVSNLRKAGYNVKVVMTKNAAEFVAPLTFETLSNNAVAIDMFAGKTEYNVEHISLAKEASVFVVAPATANVIAKFAGGIADDMLTTTFLASKATKIICPAMNTNMYESEPNAENMRILKSQGVIFVEPESGLLACGDVGNGRLANPSQITEVIDKILTPNPDFRGKRVLITAGATVEDIDGVRFISNYSSGKMGVALSEAVTSRGGEVIFICGKMSVKFPDDAEVIAVKSTRDMYDAVMSNMDRADIIMKAAAPADYRAENPYKEKIKSENLTLKLIKNPDIAKAVGERKGDKILVAFAAETNDLLENAAIKLSAKNADIIVANDVTAENAGFNSDTNIAVLLFNDGRITSLPCMLKSELAHCILDAINDL